MSEDRDPTEIEMEADVEEDEDPYADWSPYEIRSKGWTRHKNLYFNAPYITEILPGFYVGGTNDFYTLPPNIEYYLSLYKWGSYKIKHQLKGHQVIEMYDAEGEVDAPALWELAEWVHESRQRGVTVVTCQAGLNRSGLVAAAALTLDGYTGREAIDLLREKRSPAVLCNQSFEDFILGLDHTS